MVIMGTDRITILAVTEDSRVHSLLSDGIARDFALELVGAASSGSSAVLLAANLLPDVVAVDMMLPGEDSAAIIRKLRRVCPAAIVAIGTAKLSALEALRLGADDFLHVPIGGSESDNSFFLHDAMAKLKIATAGRHTVPIQHSCAISLIAIAGSAGGPAPLTAVIRSLPPKCPPVILAQHNSASFGDMASLLEKMTSREVVMVTGREQAREGCIYINAPDRHIAVCHVEGKLCAFSQDGSKVNGRRPSADVLFRSAEGAAGAGAAGVLLHESGRDGREGLAALAAKGAVALARNNYAGIRMAEGEAMPTVRELTLEDIALELARLCAIK
jgi:two-component system, chemotaxis family, protein-glutamate methylesterase/glutaminase